MRAGRAAERGSCSRVGGGYGRIMDELVKWFAALAATMGGSIIGLRAFWRLRSELYLRRAGERPLHSRRAVIWRDPGAVERLDLAAGPGGRDGAPQAPFRFVEEHSSGSRPCVSAIDARGRRWRIKWGDEVQVETLATRLVWAVGYFVETTYYVPAGVLEGATALRRAAACVDEGGRFGAARLELEEDDVITHFDEHSWSWADNPFVGTRELHGLKIVMMWLSNWDAKDVRDVARGSNTAIFEYRTRSGGREARYLVTDWGGALGRWGSVVSRGRWDAEGFAQQTPQFVTGVDGERVVWGYSGQRTPDIAGDIRVSDVRWLLRHLGRLEGRQISAAVRASGGTEAEAALFTRALLERVDQLRAIAVSPSATPADVPSSAVP